MARRKYDNNSVDYHQWTTKRLKEVFQELHQSIEVVECFSVSDLTMYELINRELGRRKVTATTAVVFS